MADPDQLKRIEQKLDAIADALAALADADVLDATTRRRMWESLRKPADERRS